MPRELLIDVERRRYPRSGLGFYCACLERALRELAESVGDELSFSFYGKKVEDGPQDYKPFASWHRHITNPYTWGKDLVHATHQMQEGLLLGSKRAKYVVTLHDLNYLYEQLSPLQRYRRHRATRRNLERADAIVCISEFVRQSLMEHRDKFKLKEGVIIEVIHNGLEFGNHIGTRPSALQIDESVPYILNIGVLQHKKQQHLLVEMLAHLSTDIHLILVYSGENEYASVIRKSIEKHGLEDRVHFLPNVSDEEKTYLLRHCLAYAHPSLAEGFGIPPIEAMYLGKPVFLSRHTSLPEIGGNEAYYFDKAEGEDMAHIFEQGISDYQADAEKSERLKAWAKHYDYRSMGAKYVDIYKRILEL